MTLQSFFRQLCRFSSKAAKARLQTLFSIQRENGWSKRCRVSTDWLIDYPYAQVIGLLVGQLGNELGYW